MSPTILILAAGLSQPIALTPPLPEVIAVWQPGFVAVPLSDAVALRPYLSARYGLGQGGSVGLGIQVVWIVGGAP